MIDMKKFMTAIVSNKDKDIDKMLAETLEYLDWVHQDYNPKINILTDAFYKSAISWAAYLNDGSTVKKFLDKGASPNGIVSRYDEEKKSYLPSDTYSPLCYACQKNYSGMVELLIERGADVNIRWGNPVGLGKQAIHFAVEWDAVTCARTLLEAGADPSSHIELGKFPLLLANSIDMINLLLEFGADVNQIEPGGGESALAYRAFRGNAKLVKHLIKHGASVNSSIDSVLHSAVMSGNIETVKAVIDAGADRAMKNGKGKTAFDYAIEYGEAEEIKELVKF